MQAVILAGGMGTRLKPFTEQIPKVMVSINGKPFLWHLLELLKGYGINNVILCVGYLPEQIRDYFGNGSGFGLSIKYSQEKEGLLGTGGALKQAQNLLDERFLVINGDTYLPVDYRRMEDVFRQRDKQAMTVVYDNGDDTGVKNNVALDDEAMVAKYDKKNISPDLKYVEAGVLALHRETLSTLEEGHAVSLEAGLYPTLIRERQLAAYVTERKFHDIGTLEQMKAFEAFLAGEAG